MKYRKQIIELMLDENDDALSDWIDQQPELDQPDIFREVKELIDEISSETEFKDIKEQIQGFDNFENLIDRYEDVILDEKLAKATYNMALEEEEKTAQEIFAKIEGLREHIIECITTNAPNAEEMRELSKLVIKFELDVGIFKAENWAAIQ